MNAFKGAHFVLYSSDPEADRAFFRDVLQLGSVDVGGGWLIFGLPPSEIAVHPASGPLVQRLADREMSGAVLYLMCDDLDATMKLFESKQIACSNVETARWGRSTSIRLPGGGRLGLYQPAHATAFEAGRRA